MTKFRAELKLRSTESGGRKGPIFSGYRPIWNEKAPVSSLMGSACAQVTFEGEVKPGDCAVVTIQPLTPYLWLHIREGSVLVMREGPHEVGEAVVTGVERK